MRKVWITRFHGGAPEAWHRPSGRLPFRAALTACLAMALNLACESRASAPSTRPAEPPTASPTEHLPDLPATRVEVGRNGFQPSRVALGTARSLIFRRTTDDTCATSVGFPALGIQRPLPLNTDVTIELPATLTEEVIFQCGMGMHRGKVVAR